MICTSIQNKTYTQIIDILKSVEMAEVRLDTCSLTDEEITDLFQNSEIPLVATCRYEVILKSTPEMKPWAAQMEAERRLNLAVEAGARYADMELEQNATISKRFQKLCHQNGVEIIRSYHNFRETPDDTVLGQALERCYRYGAEVAKVVTICKSTEDMQRLMALYDRSGLPGGLIAFGMGELARESRIECLAKGAPFSFAAISEDEATAPGQFTTEQMIRRVYAERKAYNRDELRMPASKSFAQRAIIAAALAEGTSHLQNYTPCDDSRAAVGVARALGAEVNENGTTLVIRGIGPIKEKLLLEKLNVGESGLLARLTIPLVSTISSQDCVIDGQGTLLRRPMKGASDIMAAFGVILTNTQKRAERELHIPAHVRGELVPGTADLDGSAGSQLISGLLMALPLCNKDSNLYVSEPKSIPYMYITLDVLRKFGIFTRSEMEGNAEMLEQQDWSYCTGINFKIRGGQTYKAADFSIEGDWSSAAAFLVAGAIFGSARIRGLDDKSLQADISILDILVDAGAVVSLDEDGAVCVRKAPLEAFKADLSNAPDLFPMVALLSAFCDGTSRLAGVGRLSSKESNRAEAIVGMLTQMEVPVQIQEDEMVITGSPLNQRLLCGTLLKGGQYSSHHDHRMVMALKVASIGADGPVVIDDEACVAKSFPEFTRMI